MIQLNDLSLNMIVVGDIDKAGFMASRFQLEKQQEYVDDFDIPRTPKSLARHQEQVNRGLLLRNYQNLIVVATNMLMTMYDDDDFVEDLKNGEACDWLIDMQDLVTDFNRLNPTFHVHSVVPLDLEGTVAFIGRNNMTPSI